MPLPEDLGEAPEYDIMSLDRHSSAKAVEDVRENGRSSGNAGGDRRKGNFRRSKSPAVITEHPERTSTDTHRHTGEGETDSKKRNNNHRYNHRRRPSAITTGHRPILPQNGIKPDKFVLDIFMSGFTNCKARLFLKYCYRTKLKNNKTEKRFVFLGFIVKTRRCPQ